MKYRKAYSLFAVIVGSLMVLMWVFFISAGLVPEFKTKPAEITLHIIAEMTTGIVLIIAGFMTYKASKSARWIYTFSLGMLMYTLIVSPGYYIQMGDVLPVIMFAVLLILAILSLFMFVSSRSDIE